MIENIFIEPQSESFEKLVVRPYKDHQELAEVIENIFNQVQKFGDKSLIDFTERFDKCTLDNLLVAENEIDKASFLISKELKDAIRLAKINIEKFHSAQLNSTITVNILDGVECSQKSVAIERVGIYIPGGTAPLYSTVLMLSIPAILAGCKDIVLCSPPNYNGEIHPAILWTANLCGIKKIYKVGGAQAIAGMSIGTDSIRKVNKIFGPGNQYVTAAKSYAQHYGTAMDMPAGPSEVLIFADSTCVPQFVAADLLSQSEHGIDSQVILVSENQSIISKVNAELKFLNKNLPRKEIVVKSLLSSKALVIKDINDAFNFINEYAPEHLIIASENASKYVKYIVNAGSVFLGNYCPESAGDYASGTNHTLPTNGWAKSYNGVNVDSFTRKITFQSISKHGITKLGNTIITMAENENLQAHANAVKLRLKYIEDDRA